MSKKQLILNKVIFLNKNQLNNYSMFNTHEHILHLYECIDEIRDDIHLLRLRQNLDGINDTRTNFYDPFSSLYPPLISSFNTNSTTGGRAGTRGRIRSGLNWSAERENIRSSTNRQSGASGSRRLSPLNNNSTNRNTTSQLPRRNTNTNTNNFGLSNRTIIDAGTDNLNPSVPRNPTVSASTPNSVEFTFFEPNIASVRERIDNLINRIQRDHSLTPSASEILSTGINVAASTVEPDNLGDDRQERLTLAEINTGTETKIFNGEEEETCSICREPINGNSIVREIKNCRHKFHILCLDTWLENRRTCPVCRGNVCLNSDTAENRNTQSNTVVDDLD